MAKNNKPEIYEFLNKDINQLREDVSGLKIVLARVDEGIKRINGSVQRHEEQIFKHEGFIESTKARVAFVATIVSTIIAGLIGLFFKFVGDK